MLCGFIESVGMLGRKYEIAECYVTTTHHLPSCEFKLLCVRSCVRLNSLLTSVSPRQTRDCSLRCFCGLICLNWCTPSARPPAGRGVAYRRTRNTGGHLPVSRSVRALLGRLASPDLLITVAGRGMRNALSLSLRKRRFGFWLHECETV